MKNQVFNSLKKILPLLLCILIITSCKKSPLVVQTDTNAVFAVADFEFVRDPDNAFKYTFKNLSSKYKRFEWRFGDDSLTTELNPTHIYATTGKYVVDLKTFSETGHTTRKLVNLLVSPDSVAKITCVKTGVANQVQFGITVKAAIASILWTFNDVSPAITSNLPNPVKTYTPGSFNQVSVKVVTTSGSVLNVSRGTATSEGFAEDITLGKDSYTTSAENNLNSAENSYNVLDDNIDSKYTMGGKDGRLFTYPLLVTAIYVNPQIVKIYAVANSNDNPPRDPKTWTVQGSNDGINWEILDTRTMTKNFYDQMTALGATTDAARYKKLFYYAIANPKPFTRYRWSINSNWGDAAMQTNDFRLYR